MIVNCFTNRKNQDDIFSSITADVLVSVRLCHVSLKRRLTQNDLIYRQCSSPIAIPSVDSFWPDVICGGCPWVIVSISYLILVRTAVSGPFCFSIVKTIVTFTSLTKLLRLLSQICNFVDYVNFVNFVDILNIVQFVDSLDFSNFSSIYLYFEYFALLVNLVDFVELLYFVGLG